LTINNPNKDENADDKNLGDRVLSAFVHRHHGKDFLEFSTYTYDNDWTSNENEKSNLLTSIDCSDDLEEWIFVYFAYSMERRRAVIHVRFDDHVATEVLEDVYHFIPHWIGAYVARDFTGESFNGKMGHFELWFGGGSFIESRFKKIYEPRPTEIAITGEKVRGDEFLNEYLDNPYDKKDAVYKVTLTPELLEDVEEFGVSLWFRFSVNQPKDNPTWANLYKKCHNIFRIRETEVGDAANLGDRSVIAMFCPTKDGSISLRAATFDVPTKNSNLNKDNRLNFAEFEGTWIWMYGGYSMTENKMVFVAKFPRSDKTISVITEATHFKSLSKLQLVLGNDNHLLVPNGAYAHINFSWE